MERIPVVTTDGKQIGYVASEYAPEFDRTWWHSWRPQDPLERPIGSHQDQAQAEVFLAELAPQTSGRWPSRVPK